MLPPPFLARTTARTFHVPFTPRSRGNEIAIATCVLAPYVNSAPPPMRVVPPVHDAVVAEETAPAFPGFSVTAVPVTVD